MVKGWVECPITEVLKAGGIKIGPFGSQLKKEMLLSDGLYRVYGQENVYEHDFNLGDRYLTRDHFNRLNSCEILPGDFVMSTMGTIGKCAIVPPSIQRGIMDSHLIRLRFDDKKIRPDYMLQLFSDQYHYLSDQTARLAVGGIMDGLSVGIVSRLNVVYPESLEEQQKIIRTLSEVDCLITDLQKLIRKKKDIRQGTMQMLVTGKMRLDGYSGDWVKINLAKNSKLKARIGWQGLTTAEYLDEGYSFLITGTDFDDGRINWNGCHFVNYDRYVQDPNIQVTNKLEEKLSKYQKVKQGMMEELLTGKVRLS